MAVEVEPPELARLLDIAERPRAAGWSFRAALTRYAQPQPQRASAVIECLRRIDAGTHPHLKLLAREGPAVWAELESEATAAGAEPPEPERALVVELLRTMAALDRLGDVLAAWAVNREGERPDNDVDAVVAATTQRLDELGVAREERPPRPRAGQRG